MIRWKFFVVAGFIASQTTVAYGQTIAQRVQKLEKDVATLKAQVSSIGTDKTAAQQINKPTPTDIVNWFNPQHEGNQPKICPDEYYVAGIGGKDTDPGGYCSDCISWLGMICRPFFPAPK